MNRRRTKNLVIRLTETERAELDAVAEHLRVSASDVVRMGVRERFVALFGDAKAKRTKATKQ